MLALELDQATRLAQSQRPELKELALGVDRAREGVTLARSSNYPQMNLFGSFEKQPQQPIHPVGEILTAGVQATWTFWEWNRSSHERAEAEFRRLRAITDLEDRRGIIVQEVRAAFAEARMAEGRVLAFREEVEAARSASKVAEQRFRDKVGVEHDVTVSRIEVTRALARYRAVVYEAYLTRARLERVLGVEELPTETGGAFLSSDQPTDSRPVQSTSLKPASSLSPDMNATTMSPRSRSLRR